MTAEIAARVEVSPSGPRTVRELLTETRARHASRPALRDRFAGAWRRFSYAALSDSAENFGAGLVRLGLQPGDKVAIIAGNSIDWAVAWLGVALAGGVNVPVSGELGQHEITNIIRQSDSRVAVVGAPFASKLDHRSLDRVIVIAKTGARSGDDLAATIARFGAKGILFADIGAGVTDQDRRKLRERAIRPSDLAAILYTSGTTGDPKGVMLSHRNLVSDAVAACGIVTANSSDRLLLVLPLHHAFPFTAGLLGPLHAGAEIVLENDLRRVRDRMGEVHPTIFHGVPALYAQMYRTITSRLEAEGKLATFRKAERLSVDVKRRTGLNIGRPIFRELHDKLGGSIRFLAVGGAGVPPEIVRKYAALGFPMMQGWGLTEAAPVVAGQSPHMSRFLFTDYYERIAGSVGLPMRGVDIRMVDVPDKNIYAQLHGEGEFVVRGPNVMHGYYKNEAATQEVLLGDWLRTGDLGRVDREGHIYLTGRAKSVIVLDSGEKVYPDEVEERFESLSLSQDVCVLGRRPNRLIGERKVQVVAVVHPDPVALRERARESRERLTPDLVRRWVQQEVDAVQSNLAPFKRIGEVVLTDAPLPRTDLKKIRRAQIRDHYSFDLDKLLALEGQPEV